MYKDFWDLYIKGYGRLRLAMVICAVTAVMAVMEGLNVSLLVPLLETLNGQEGEGNHWVSNAVSSILHKIGLPFELWSIVAVLAILVSAISGLKYLRMILTGKLQVGFLIWMRSTYMWNLLHADISLFHSEKLGVLSDNIHVQTDRGQSVVINFTEMLANLGVAFAYLVAAFLIAPALTAISLALLLLVSLGMQFFVARAGALGATLVQRDKDLQVAVLETLSGVHVVKSYVLERLKWRDFTKRAEDVGDTSYRLTKNNSQITVLQEVLVFGLIGAMVFVGASVLDLGIAVVVTLLFILYRLAPRITGLNTQRHGVAVALASLHSVKVAIEDASSPKVGTGDRQFVELNSRIELDDVRFSYNGGAQVLCGVRFTAEKGKMTAIVGASGAGKTTIVDLLLRLHDPTGGSIQVDGVDLRELDLTSWRKAIGVVSQDVFLFNDTVANNIAVGRPEATTERVEDAAKQAYAHDFILQLPNGYETLVGDRGWNLSGGQRQRIALARAIIGKPQLLILDEATSSVDSESEQLIQRYINEIRGACTMVVVAHRLSTIQRADKIVVLQDGAIIEEGDWYSLVQGGGVLANYHHLQFSGSGDR